MAQRLLVGHDGTAASTHAVAQATRMALAEHGRLTVVLALPRVAPCVMGSPVSYMQLEREVRLEAQRALARAVHEVSVTTVATQRRLGAALRKAWRSGEHDIVVLAPGGPLARRLGALRLRLGGVPLTMLAPPPRVASLPPRRGRRPAGRPRSA